MRKRVKENLSLVGGAGGDTQLPLTLLHSLPPYTSPTILGQRILVSTAEMSGNQATPSGEPVKPRVLLPQTLSVSPRGTSKRWMTSPHPSPSLNEMLFVGKSHIICYNFLCRSRAEGIRENVAETSHVPLSYLFFHKITCSQQDTSNILF